jgi:hypothetical protein
MKNVFSIAALAALTMFAASCGNDEAEAKRKADSAHQADSVAAAMAQWKADSTRVADSTANVAKEMEAKRVADSIRVADSMAKLKPGSKPKTPTQQKKEENKKATGGRG